MKRVIVICMVGFALASSSLANKLSKTVFVSFDTETTGVDFRHGRIVEIGAVKFRGKAVIATTNWLINPQMPIPPVVIKVHGIDDKMVKDAPDFKHVMPQFRKFIGDAPLIAHNARFDVNFVAAECQRNGLPLPKNPTIDSLALARRYLPKAPAHNLVALSKYLKLKESIHHRGLEDSIYVQQMMPIIFKKMGRRNSLKRLIDEAGIPWPQATEKPGKPAKGKETGEKRHTSAKH